jgi:hypothetical protein
LCHQLEELPLSFACSLLEIVLFLDSCSICRVGENGGLYAQFICRLLGVRKNFGAQHLELLAEERQLRVGHVVTLRHGQELLLRQLAHRLRPSRRLDDTIQDFGIHEDLRGRLCRNSRERAMPSSFMVLLRCQQGGCSANTESADAQLIPVSGRSGMTVDRPDFHIVGDC